jgi:hypothetical protein
MDVIAESLALRALIAVILLIYGAAHGGLVAWVWVRHEHLLIPTLLFISPVGVTLCLLAAGPFVGWVAVATVIVTMAVGFAPVALIVWWAVFRRNTRGLG